LIHTELCGLPIEKLAPLLARKKVSPVEVLEAILQRIERLQPILNAYLTVTAEAARRDAARAEREITKGRYRGPLHGIPIALKDNISTRGVERIPGGSSGGSAAGVAAGLCAASIGTDTGGSIRVPAALCGTVGLKPSYGRVSCHGVVPLAKSLDHVGVLARKVADVAILLGAIAGHDPLDPTTANTPVPDYQHWLRQRRRKLRLGWPREHFWERLDGEVQHALEAARRSFEQMGARVEEVSLPHAQQTPEASASIAHAEALAAHQAAGYYPARMADYSPELRTLLEAGNNVRAVDYLLGFETQKAARADFDAAFERVDATWWPGRGFCSERSGLRPSPPSPQRTRGRRSANH
jgi:aspartyl-tRNA(Asn)/glutamyl-tRNA(Gln) amidotransferase subunit A